MVLDFVVFHALDTLGFGAVKEYFVHPFFLFDDQGFHGLSVNQALGTFRFEGLVAFVADVIFVAFGHYVILCLVGQVIVGPDFF